MSFLIQKIEPAYEDGSPKGSTIYTDIPSPKSYHWSKKDISAHNAGRAANTRMKKKLKGKARVITLSWAYPDYALTASILQAFDHEYLWVTYFDALTGVQKRSLMYIDDLDATSYTATKGGKWEAVNVTCIQAWPDPP